ncbi:MAG TPA: hypothetical protein VFH83_14995, partial [Spirochaetia bacterium]|nr:hypothetical protein [Spirochaetia bacterium]
MTTPFGLLRYRVARRLMVSYFVLAVLTIVALSSILFALFARSAAAQIAAGSRELLQRTAYAADVLDSQVQVIGSYLINDLDVVLYLYSKEDDKVLAYNAMRVLDRIISEYTFIRSIGLYNRTTGGYLNNAGMASRVPFPDSISPEIRLTPRVISAADSPDRRSHPVLTGMLYPYAFSGAPETGAIELNIDEGYLQSLIAGIAGSAERSVTMVMDSSGMVLSHPDPGRFMRDLSKEGYASRILG